MRPLVPSPSFYLVECNWAAPVDWALPQGKNSTWLNIKGSMMSLSHWILLGLSSTNSEAADIQWLAFGVGINFFIILLNSLVNWKKEFPIYPKDSPSCSCPFINSFNKFLLNIYHVLLHQLNSTLFLSFSYSRIWALSGWRHLAWSELLGALLGQRSWCNLLVASLQPEPETKNQRGLCHLKQYSAAAGPKGLLSPVTPRVGCIHLGAEESSDLLSLL